MSLSVSEREKYDRMWTLVPNYRHTSPGEKLVPKFLDWLGQWQPGDTVIDAGCGTGRASVALREAGFFPMLIDISDKALDPKVRELDIPFARCCLWEMKDIDIVADWVYCCDVLEHIPTVKVDATLSAIAACARKGAFLQIAMFHEQFGKEIKETLHLTVENEKFWRAHVDQFFVIRNWEDSGDGRIITLVEPRD